MSKADMVVLGFLHIKPMYGYEIIQFVKDRELDVWAGIKMPSVYKALHRLEKKDHVKGEQITEGNNPPRTVYCLTESGVAYFRKMLKNILKQKHVQSHDFWLATSFMNKSLKKNFFLEVLEQRIFEVEKHLDCHRKETLKNKAEEKGFQIPFFVNTLITVGEKIHEVELEGLRELKKEAGKAENSSVFISEEEN